MIHSLRKYTPTIWINFCVLCFLALLVSWSFQQLLFSEALYYNTFADQLSYETINNLIEQREKWGWVGYLLTPLIYLIKISLVSTCLALGFFFISNRFDFRSFFNVAVLAELVFLLPVLIKLLWFLFVQTDYNLNDLALFYPLSALNFIDGSGLPRYWLAPLQTLNLFEVSYWLLLTYGVANATGFSLKRSLGLVMSSYGVGLILWVVLMMFVSVTYS